MRSRFAAVLTALALPILTLTACGSEEQPTVVEVVTTTSVSSSASSSTSSSSSTTETPSSTQAPAAATAAGAGACGAYGYTAAPGQEAAHCMDKQVASCGDPSIHEMGTTFFTDGSSGWTQTCQSQMAAAYVPPAPTPTFDQDAYNKQFEEEYWRNNPRPTFDPDSADGYGPDQTIPPACLRFENVDC